MGFSPDLVVGVYVGMDTPEQMGRETGSSSAVPIVKDFLETVLKNQSKVPFRIPDGVTLAPVNRTTGEPTYIGAPDFILEAFKPGTEPTVGGLRSTTRFGSGTDSLGGFFGSTPVFDENEAGEDTETSIEVADAGAAAEGETEATSDAGDPKAREDGNPEEESSDVETELSSILDRAENALNDTPADVETPELPEVPVEIAPETEKPVEDALDDGLY